MNRNTIEKILTFLKEKEDKELPINWKMLLAKENTIRTFETHPDDVQYRYEGDLGLSGRNITKLPNDLYVTGDLDLAHCKQLTKLPDKLYVGGFLDLANTNITSLPNNLYIKDWLDLENCKQITELPKKLYVGGYLYMRNTLLVNKYTEKEIRDIVASTGGEIKQRIIMY
jgi:hypothetical protein